MMLLIRTILTIAITVGTGLVLWLDHVLKSDVGFTAVILFVVVFSVKELYGLARQKGHTPYPVWGTFCAGLMVFADWLGYAGFHPEKHWVGLAAFIFLFGLFVLQGWVRPRERGFSSMAVTAFGILYVWGLAHFIVRIRHLAPHVVGVRGVLLFAAVIKGCDIMAYLVGQGLGRHRAFPKLSPNKTWEGYVGGLAGSLLAGFVAQQLLFDRMTWWMLLLFALPVYLFGNVGDLAESVIKRDLGAKHSGVRLPGLGGVLDIVDSLLLAAPVAFYVLEQMVIMEML